MGAKSLNTAAKKKAMIAALVKTMGNVSQSAEIAGVDRRTHYKWMDADKEYAEQVADIPERVLDFVEAKLLQNISKGKETSTIFYLKTKGKQRGYIEKQERELTIKELPSWLKE